MVRQEGFEPPAYCLEGSCSIQLSYWRKLNGAGDGNRTRIPSLEGWCPSHCATPACALRKNRQLCYNSISVPFCQRFFRIFLHLLSIIIKRTETQLSQLCVFSLLQPHRTEVRLTGKYRYLTFEDRKKIEAWHLLGDRPVDIAARLSVHHTTIYKELQRGATGALDANQREGYSAELAERRLRESFKRRGKRAPAAQ